MRYTYILTILAFILLKNEISHKYIRGIFIALSIVMIIMGLIDIYLLLNRDKLGSYRNNYITRKVNSLDSEIVKIKNNKLEYVLKSELGFLFMLSILILIEIFFYELGYGIKIVSYILTVISVCKILIISIYDKFSIIKDKLKIIKGYLIIKESIIYVIYKIKVSIIIFLVMLMIVRI